MAPQKKRSQKENYNTDFPIQFYAATKANELMLHSYSHQLKMPVTVMRFLQFMVLLEDPIWHYLNFKIFTLKNL